MLAGASTVTEKFRKQKRTEETKERIAEKIIIKKEFLAPEFKKPRAKRGREFAYRIALPSCRTRI